MENYKDGRWENGCIDGHCDDGNSTLTPVDADLDGYSTCDGDCNDGNIALTPQDSDGDGYSTCDGDCDDDDSGRSSADLDGDGLSTCDGDCDDSDSTLTSLDLDGDGVIDSGELDLRETGGSSRDFRASWGGYNKTDYDKTFIPVRAMRH